jgi:hypothetical protein
MSVLANQPDFRGLSRTARQEGLTLYYAKERHIVPCVLPVLIDW